MSESYQVLARKYRPQTFADLMGQGVLVKTLKNAIENKRIPHAILLTGVRGIGKTTTARIIARSLNCVGADGTGSETIAPCGVCQPCVDILNERHLDVIEMDAASRTSVEDIRRVIEAAYYKPASARYKIQIIDEVHMLTKQAFNALLKTLEEPPEYTKFIFATTELNRVPDTIISRCVRFDLKRFNRETLVSLLSKTCQQESIRFEEDAIGLLAIAANGSARDAQSLLERAISLSNGNLQTYVIRDMLGLTGHADTIEMLTGIIQGQTQSILGLFAKLYENGGEPDQILSSLCDLVHTISVLKTAPALTPGLSLSTEDLETLKALATSLDIPVLTRLWQVLTKGREELRGAASGKQAVDMILIRACYLSDQPTAQSVLRQLGGVMPSSAAKTTSDHDTINSDTAQKKSHNDEPLVRPTVKTTNETNPLQRQTVDEVSVVAKPSKSPIVFFHDLIQACEDYKEPLLKYELENHVRLIDMDAEALVLRLAVTADAKSGLSQIIQGYLREWSGQDWRVEGHKGTMDSAPSSPHMTIRDQKKKEQTDLIEEAKATPLVSEALKTFPNAIIKDVKKRS